MLLGQWRPTGRRGRVCGSRLRETPRAHTPLLPHSCVCAFDSSINTSWQAPAYVKLGTTTNTSRQRAIRAAERSYTCSTLPDRGSKTLPKYSNTQGDRIVHYSCLCTLCNLATFIKVTPQAQPSNVGCCACKLRSPTRTGTGRPDRGQPGSQCAVLLITTAACMGMGHGHGAPRHQAAGSCCAVQCSALPCIWSVCREHTLSTTLELAGTHRP